MDDPAPLPPLTDAFFDEIVDGGLSPARLRQAIERLDREPDGWKRCALAFLEAQCWGESFRSIEEDYRSVPGAVVHPSPAAPRASQSARWGSWAVAAGIAAVAFVLGWQIRPDRRLLPPEGAALPVVSASPDPGAHLAAVGDPPDPNAVGPDAIESDGPSAPSIATVGRIRLGPDEGAASVPIVGGPGLDERWVAGQPPAITEHQMALLERSGYHVDRHRRLVTATLRDGRRVAVPVDRFQVRYTGNGPL